MLVAQIPVITLDESTRQIAELIARMRHEADRKAGVIDRQIGPQDSFVTDLEGVAAEMAFCRMTNLYFDFYCQVRSGGYDCLTRNGKSVDVKTTRYQTGRMLATLKKHRKPADYYVLMIGTFPTYRWAGWAKASELFRRENIVDLGHGRGYALDQNRLREPKTKWIIV